MFVSDAGRSLRGFEYNAEWNVTWTVEGTTGTLTFGLHVGLGDAPAQHEYLVTEFAMDRTRVGMRVNSRSVAVIWMDDEVVCDGTHHRYYIGSWGNDAPPEEIGGTISPTAFAGLTDFRYVELPLRE